MSFIQDWINEKLQSIAKKLPDLVDENPSGFSCGFNMGYKRALLDLDCLIEEGAVVRKSLCNCGDRYHPHGARCL